MRNSIKILVILLFGILSCCKSPYISLYSNEDEVSFTNNNISNEEKIEFTYIPSIYYSTPGKLNSKNGAENYRSFFKKGFDSIVDLRHSKINITNKISLKQKPNLKDSIQNEMLGIIKKIDTTKSIHSVTLSQSFKDLLSKFPTKYSIAVFNNINLTTQGALDPNTIHFQRDFIRTRNITIYSFIFDNRKNKLVNFNKSSKIDGYISKEDQYKLFEAEILMFMDKIK